MHYRDSKKRTSCGTSILRDLFQWSRFCAVFNVARCSTARIKLRGNIARFLALRGSNSRIARLRVSPKPRNAKAVLAGAQTVKENGIRSIHLTHGITQNQATKASQVRWTEGRILALKKLQGLDTPPPSAPPSRLWSAVPGVSVRVGRARRRQVRVVSFAREGMCTDATHPPRRILPMLTWTWTLMRTTGRTTRRRTRSRRHCGTRWGVSLLRPLLPRPPHRSSNSKTRQRQTRKSGGKGKEKVGGKGKGKGRVDDSEDEVSRRRSPKFPQPHLIAGATLHPYQLEGLQWMLGLDEQGISGILIWLDCCGREEAREEVSVLGFARRSSRTLAPFGVLARTLRAFRTLRTFLRVLLFRVLGARPRTLRTCARPRTFRVLCARPRTFLSRTLRTFASFASFGTFAHLRTSHLLTTSDLCGQRRRRRFSKNTLVLLLTLALTLEAEPFSFLVGGVGVGMRMVWTPYTPSCFSFHSFILVPLAWAWCGVMPFGGCAAVPAGWHAWAGACVGARYGVVGVYAHIRPCWLALARLGGGDGARVWITRPTEWQAIGRARLPWRGVMRVFRIVPWCGAYATELMLVLGLAAGVGPSDDDFGTADRARRSTHESNTPRSSLSSGGCDRFCLFIRDSRLPFGDAAFHELRRHLHDRVQGLPHVFPVAARLPPPGQCDLRLEHGCDADQRGWTWARVCEGQHCGGWVKGGEFQAE
ncbi:hypothetical protein B0H16DRAFT_1706882 [Mycena metata]|uniref:Uncharacterized protein n=1 Tax=Mycena metata TaxID=1033252 RepID=A0AAD7DLE1_9AGAR|nr:hypothetical protein B0H16DRAFT_1706882 [Mycena metata]